MWPSAANNQRSKSARAPAVPFANRSLQTNNWVEYDEVPPAGKKSSIVTAGKLSAQDLSQMQSTLSSLMMRKQNVSLIKFQRPLVTDMCFIYS